MSCFLFMIAAMEDTCSCAKPKELCVCDPDLSFENKHFVYILQHPQESDELLGTAVLVQKMLKNSKLKTTLSVANLKHELGSHVVYSRWLVLYLGSKYKLRELKSQSNPKMLHVFNKKGEELDLNPDEVDGIIVLDGTWPQTKSLWWRNPWLLKCYRAVILPPRPSLYGQFRREPRKESLSTIEAVAYALLELGEDSRIAQTLLNKFQELINKFRQYYSAGIKPEAPPQG